MVLRRLEGDGPPAERHAFERRQYLQDPLVPPVGSTTAQHFHQDQVANQQGLPPSASRVSSRAAAGSGVPRRKSIQTLESTRITARGATEPALP